MSEDDDPETFAELPELKPGEAAEPFSLNEPIIDTGRRIQKQLEEMHKMMVCISHSFGVMSDTFTDVAETFDRLRVIIWNAQADSQLLSRKEKP